MNDMVHKVIDVINSFSTVVIAVFTVVMCYVVRNQNRATQIAERAWIVSDMEAAPPYEPNQTIRYVCRIRNKGRTPAWITEMGSRGHVVKTENDLLTVPPYDMAGPFPKKGTPLPPEAFIPHPFWLDSAKLEKVEQGELTLYLFGMVKYRDVFDEEHEMRYCYQFKPALGGTDPAMRDFYFGGPKAYNSAT